MAEDLTRIKSQNPVYERVLIDILINETSAEKKSIFSTCLNSLRLFPLPLSSPAHCRILEGFTKKVVRILEEKLKDPISLSPIKKHSMSWDDPVELPTSLLAKKPSHPPAENKRVISTTDDDEEEDIQNVFAPSGRKKTKKSSTKSSSQEIGILDGFLDPSSRETSVPREQGNKSAASVPVIDLEEPNASSESHNLPNASSESHNLPNASSESHNLSKKNKEYVPKTGSGAYAVLMTLFKKHSDPCYPGFMTKEEIISEAKGLSTESFTRSRDPQGHYTAWSGVSILEKKDLTKSWSRNPKKFTITEKGIDLARRISVVEGGSFQSASPPTEQITSASTTFEQASWLDRLASLRYCYVKNSNANVEEETNQQDLAEMDIDDGVYYLIKCLRRELEGSGLKYRIKNVLSDGVVLAYLHENDASEHSPISSSRELIPKAIEKQPLLIEPPPPSKKKPRGSNRVEVPKDVPPVGYDDQSDAIEAILTEEERLDPKKDFRHWIKTPGSPPSGFEGPLMSQEENVISEFTLCPGGFEVILLVDSAEIQSSKVGGKSTRREVTLDELNANGVRFEKRNMNIGDFLWIAKEKVEIDPSSFRQREPRELVLPYMVERKRMDDLQKSIMDQRYAEQKFRMKNSGIKNLYYLVENCGGMDRHRGIGPSALEQAMANTVVQEGFFINRTKTQKESMEFITTMTRVLAKKYSGVTLRSCVKEDIMEGRVSNPEITLMSYKEFNELSRKNRQFTIKEVFMKMLLQLKGLTPGMALSIVQKYPTPLSLLKAFAGKTEKETNTLLQGLRYDGGKKVPINVSRSIGMLYSKEVLQ